MPTVTVKQCDCGEHPDWSERCSPVRGYFGCDGKYRMPRLPDGMVCKRQLSSIAEQPGMITAQEAFKSE